MQSFAGYAENLSVQEICSYASQGNLQELKKYQKLINIVDSDGNSAICKAILNNDIKGYNTLKTAGANMKPECIKNISAQTYNDFMNTLKIKGISGGDVATDSTSGTFLGMGTIGWSITGAAVLGGIAAVAVVVQEEHPQVVVLLHVGVIHVGYILIVQIMYVYVMMDMEKMDRENV